MNILERYNTQKKLYDMNLDFAPFERWSVYIEDDRDHFVSGNVYFSMFKITAWLWAFLKIGNKRQWRLIRQKHRYL
jgi:hypothetical protein